MDVTLTLKDGSRYTISNVIPGSVRSVEQTSPFYDRANCNRIEMQCYGNEPAAHNGVALIELVEDNPWDVMWDDLPAERKEVVRDLRV